MSERPTTGVSNDDNANGNEEDEFEYGQPLYTTVTKKDINCQEKDDQSKGKIC